ncbi:MAG: hypothetical protein FJX77_07885 [Armatimonadetes bacterium]|nr:hypothetical protein [Armatimonadota bacterium]
MNDTSALVPVKETAPSSPQELYDEALDLAERLRLPRARSVEGLDSEIALLRLRLLRAARQDPDNLEKLLKGAAIIVQAVSARYRLSEKSSDNLGKAVSEVIQQIGGALGLNPDPPPSG